jgi:hypothetical protein
VEMERVVRCQKRMPFTAIVRKLRGRGGDIPVRPGTIEAI